MYIIVSVLGECPASRGTNSFPLGRHGYIWVVRETSGSSGTHLGRQGHIWVVKQRTGGWSVGRTVGRKVDARSIILESGILFRVFPIGDVVDCVSGVKDMIVSVFIMTHHLPTLNYCLCRPHWAQKRQCGAHSMKPLLEGQNPSK